MTREGIEPQLTGLQAEDYTTRPLRRRENLRERNEVIEFSFIHEKRQMAAVP